jgi:hypothetical protein
MRQPARKSLAMQFRHPIALSGTGILKIKEPPGKYPMLDVIVSVLNDGPQLSDYRGSARQRVDLCQRQWGVTFFWLLQQQMDLWDRQQWPFALAEVRAWEPAAKVHFLHFEMCKWIANYLPRGVSGYPDLWSHFQAVLLESYRHSFSRPLLSKADLRSDAARQIKAIKNFAPLDCTSRPLLSSLQSVIFKAQKSPCDTPRAHLEPGRVELGALLKQYKIANQQVRAIIYEEDPEFSLKVFCEKDGELHVKLKGHTSQPAMGP